MRPIPGTSNKKESHFRGYAPTCPHCKVSAKIMEMTILRLLEKGLKQNGLKIVRDKESAATGTPLGMLIPLIKLLRKKGIEVS